MASTEPDIACAVSDFIRCRISPTRANAPSAVCRTERACTMLLAAAFNEETSARRADETARPAASSDARTIRDPLESFDNDLSCSREFLLRYTSAELAEVLVAMTGMIDSFLELLICRIFSIFF